ncbi:hypothetical protein ABZ848_21595 [Streptomyces sp. NPDC047081]|uniref:hypothetical protein n=1 Tax=Streptomyces sp. NPDC047081 TaxID=3154706 RepID=UPI0033E90862
MTNTTSASRTSVDLDELIASARELSLAARWPRALALLDSTAVTESADRARLALAAAEVALESDWFAGTDLTPARVGAAAQLLPEDDWDLGFARLRHTYFGLLRIDGTVCFGPDGKDPEALAAVRREVYALRDRSPDVVRGGWASMYLGLITDNHFGEGDAAAAHYTAALEAGESGADPLLAREALRHLGGHAHATGDQDRALERWRRATELGAGAGNLPGTLSQQLLLAMLARDTGDEPGARALATEVARWAGAIGADRLNAQATAFLAGIDPMGSPKEDESVG